ncbi:MAG: ribosome maturation factor RimM [Candidatus Subteraquimicrobiales bacterium]|nr:ribosome maturation factor RimM [Candidatus Subteraquimicrobiales bacterium]
MKNEFIALGQIVSVHGIKGYLKVVSYTDFPERFNRGKVFCLFPPHSKFQALKVGDSSLQNDVVLVKFEEINDRNEAKDLIGRWLEIPMKEAKKLSEGHYWIHQIIGLEARTEEGELLGIIKEVIKTPANDVYVISTLKKDILIPATKEVVKKIDLKKKQVVVSKLSDLF